MPASKKPHRGRRVDTKGRSKGEARHVRLYHWMLNSPAWGALSLGGRALLIEVWKRYNGSNNGDISFSVREAARILGISKNTAAKLFRELQEIGFLVATERGSFHWKGGLATTWRLTALPTDDGQGATKDFMHWRPSGRNQNTVPAGGTAGPIDEDRRRHPNLKVVSGGT